MEQPLKQRLIGATIIIALAVIFLPMLIGQKPMQPEEVVIEIPKPPEELNSRILPLPEQNSDLLAEVKIKKDKTVVISKPNIPKPPKKAAVEGLKAWVVQVGSFSDKKNADALSVTLIKAGFTAFVDPGSNPKGDIYRVKVGPELSREKADKLALTIKQKQKLTKAIVVQYP
ncbi:MAG: sporulation-like protein [Piscirickettsiaceae bacterium]|nr:MAG: sporulation-like protein [Piscirickettsiaceae bacterium]